MIHYTFHSVYNIYIHKILVPYHLLMVSIWRFPKMEVPLTHLFISRIFHYKPTILGYPHVWKLPFEVLNPNNHYIYIIQCIHNIYIYNIKPLYHISFKYPMISPWVPYDFRLTSSLWSFNCVTRRLGAWSTLAGDECFFGTKNMGKMGRQRT